MITDYIDSQQVIRKIYMQSICIVRIAHRKHFVSHFHSFQQKNNYKITTRKKNDLQVFIFR